MLTCFSRDRHLRERQTHSATWEVAGVLEGGGACSCNRTTVCPCVITLCEGKSANPTFHCVRVPVHVVSLPFAARDSTAGTALPLSDWGHASMACMARQTAVPPSRDRRRVCPIAKCQEHIVWRCALEEDSNAKRLCFALDLRLKKGASRFVCAIKYVPAAIAAFAIEASSVAI